MLKANYLGYCESKDVARLRSEGEKSTSRLHKDFQHHAGEE